MCTVVVAFQPSSEVRLMLAAVRDELVDRPWEEPGEHWPEFPGVLGGRDLRAGGSWLALAPGTPEPGSSGPRLGAVLNGHTFAPPAGGGPRTAGAAPLGAAGLSRGRLPLLMAARGTNGLDPAELPQYDPFHLLGVDTGGTTATLRSWDGQHLAERALPAGRVSVLVNTGLDENDPRARRHGPAFAAALPAPRHQALEGATEAAQIWGDWPRLVDEAARGPARTGGHGGADDPSSLVARIELGGGRVWASTSVTLVALGRDTVRCAFTDAPGDPGAWRLVR
ncbi:hypothetical protein F4561_002894 [Lipingzhangella halophila]|uniref:Transport and Golgi organization protein 2 n=1 Tax=Lipingzhangella halophila TaxID=1783352 RepID=A0A7W7RHJ3_9ACTN|nr:NRDE family protein [Lipingzhangella halophila]MBB4932074.1 hypothetical protein [Lipingzhangella halophila]